LVKELLKKVSEIPANLANDAFGMGELAWTEGQKAGEFFTPSYIVRLFGKSARTTKMRRFSSE
jgi:type I restriction-modification system DNA methylase subunit